MKTEKVEKVITTAKDLIGHLLKRYLTEILLQSTTLRCNFFIETLTKEPFVHLIISARIIRKLSVHFIHLLSWSLEGKLPAPLSLIFAQHKESVCAFFLNLICNQTLTSTVGLEFGLYLS